MAYNEDLINLKKRVADLISEGIINPNSKDIYESTLIQVMNDAERNRQTCMTSAENLKRQAAILEGQAGGFASVSSLIIAVLNGFVAIAEKNKNELREREAERKANEEEVSAAVLEEKIPAKRKSKHTEK
jgi:hypothetical protein